MLYVIITLKIFRQRQIKFFSKSYRNTYKSTARVLTNFPIEYFSRVDAQRARKTKMRKTQGGGTIENSAPLLLLTN